MNILNWSFWHWALIFFGGPTLFFTFAGRLFPKVKNESIKTALIGTDVLTLFAVCLTSLVSLVMALQSLAGWGYGTFLLCLTVPAALAIAYALWDAGMMFLLTKSGTTIYHLNADYTLISVARPPKHGTHNKPIP
ncbi:hypothetical protein A2716_02410 [candidate division WWE3 bacterium RIFCSPHIGHO2_01_FULL_40_23]|uniref:Uncharacterized protein n=1 Tax=candidate division WWE3 bacterium RIFCSPLOWO2_01_FULL_41_18 TaxID=1802625 RepID=A0A1F4VFX6_UNCKA|nr:MAG: hypothetical protein A2716_02410 [candidate division WWE3 bacterium RIFCSPHIGHO2_01_FULL_40_23]OGC55838.1 MAG: hypothetical protein A3A78_02260 [candidate division WWE3 bacterium RIFCSPLOWO2_01_FULL_41_18]